MGVKEKVKEEFSESDRLTEQFTNQFESTFKNGLNSVFKNGRTGFKDMLGGFRDLYFNMLTEVAARPILDLMLGKQTTAFGGRSGGFVSDIIGTIFNQDKTGTPEVQAAAKPSSKLKVASTLPKGLTISDAADSSMSG